MIQRFLTLLLGSALVFGGLACKKGSSGNPDGSEPGMSDSGGTGQTDGGSSVVDAGCGSNDFCSPTQYCDLPSRTCITAKPCVADPGTGDPTGDNSCAYQADLNNPDYCGNSNCYCDVNRGGGVCLPLTPFCKPCQSDVECGNDPAIFNPTAACVSYNGLKVCLPTHGPGQACPSGYKFGSGDNASSCVPSSDACDKPGACSSDNDCDPQSAHPICNLTTGTCVEACTYDYKDHTSDCPPGEICHVDPRLLTPATNPNFGAGHCGAPCDMTNGYQCLTGTQCVPDGLGSNPPSRCRPPPPSCIRDADCPPSMTYHTLGDCNLSTLTCVNGCSKDSQCMIGFSCQQGVCAQESCTQLGGAVAACSRGQFCCGEQGGPSCPSTVAQGQCYDAPNPPWCGMCGADGPVNMPVDDVKRPQKSWCAGGEEWQSCDPTVASQCPSEYVCSPGPTFCTQDSDCGANGSCGMIQMTIGSKMIMTHGCTCQNDPSQCPAPNSTCQKDPDGGYTGVCTSHWCDMRFCFNSNSP